MVYLEPRQLHCTSAFPFIPCGTPGAPHDIHAHYHTLSCPRCMSHMLSEESQELNSHIHSPSASTLMMREKREKPYRSERVHGRHQGTEEREMCLPRRKPDERRLPVLRHQINFTLSHLPATVMSFIHPFPPVAMATLPLGAVHSFTSVFLTLLLRPSPSPDPSEPSPLYSI